MEESQSSRSAKGLRSAGVDRGPPLRFSFDGAPVDACRGESVAGALLAAGFRTLRTSPRGGEPRGTFCWMGSCQECIVVVDGLRRPACRLEAEDGMVVLSGSIP